MVEACMRFCGPSMRKTAIPSHKVDPERLSRNGGPGMDVW